MKAVIISGSERRFGITSSVSIKTSTLLMQKQRLFICVKQFFHPVMDVVSKIWIAIIETRHVRRMINYPK